MNNLELVVQDGKVMADSRKVAEMVGKRHDHLVRDIGGYIEAISTDPKIGVSDFFTKSSYRDGSGKSNVCYKLTKQGCEMVANKLTGNKGILFTATYVQQFNDMERELSRPQDSYMIADPVERAKKWIEEEQVRQQQGKELEAARPKVVFADSVSITSGTMLIGGLAKILRQSNVAIGQNRLFQWMRDNEYLISKHGTEYNMPTQKSMELGLFTIKERTINNPDGSVRITRTVLVTGKGQIYFVNKFLNRKEKSA